MFSEVTSDKQSKKNYSDLVRGQVSYLFPSTSFRHSISRRLIFTPQLSALDNLRIIGNNPGYLKLCSFETVSSYPYAIPSHNSYELSV